MKLKIFLYLFLITLIFSYPASALIKSFDQENKTISILNNAGTTTYLTIQQLSTINDIAIFQEVFSIKSFVTYTLDPSKDFISRFTKYKGKENILYFTWEIFINENWYEFDPLGRTMHNGDEYIIRLTLYKKAEKGEFSIMSIPVMGDLELPEMTWWNNSWTYRVDNTIPNGSRPHQISLNISNTTGINNATTIYCNGKCNINFTDIRFTLDNTTTLPYWIENTTITPTKIWVNLTANGTVNMFYGNPTATTTSNGNATFKFFDDFSSTLSTKWTVAGNTIISQKQVKLTGTNQWDVNGITAKTNYSQPFIMEWLGSYTSTTMNSIEGVSKRSTLWDGGGAYSYKATSPVALYLLLDVIENPTTSTWGLPQRYNRLIFDGVNISISYSNNTIISTMPYAFTPLYPSFQNFRISQTAYIDDVRVRNYASPEPQWVTWSSNTTQKKLKIYGTIIG